MSSLDAGMLKILTTAAVRKNGSNATEAGDHLVDDQLHETRYFADELTRILNHDEKLNHVHAYKLSDDESVPAESSGGMRVAILRSEVIECALTFRHNFAG